MWGMIKRWLQLVTMLAHNYNFNVSYSLSTTGVSHNHYNMTGLNLNHSWLFTCHPRCRISIAKGLEFRKIYPRSDGLLKFDAPIGARPNSSSFGLLSSMFLERKRLYSGIAPVSIALHARWSPKNVRSLSPAFSCSIWQLHMIPTLYYVH